MSDQEDNDKIIVDIEDEDPEVFFLIKYLGTKRFRYWRINKKYRKYCSSGCKKSK